MPQREMSKKLHKARVRRLLAQHNLILESINLSKWILGKSKRNVQITFLRAAKAISVTIGQKKVQFWKS
jgi:hypothetical protein